MLVLTLLSIASQVGLQASSGPGGQPRTTAPAVRAELAGRSLAAAPGFEYTRTFNRGSRVQVAIDPALHRDLVGATVDIWIVDHKDAATWAVDSKLVDLRGGSQAVSVVGTDLASNVFLVDDGRLLAGAGLQFSRGYDVVVDVDRDGELSEYDLIDGLDGIAGFYVVRNPVAAGPLEVTEVLYSGGNFLGQDLYYPTDIGSLGELPLIVISHGNGHNYQWYDHLGYHMASWGYVVMSHQNNTGPGIETASQTTLINTNYILSNLDTIDGGVLQGHVDSHNIVWIGHSRGGEGVTRAYDRLFDQNISFASYGLEDIKLVSSIAPTVFFERSLSNPHAVNYHLWTGGADADVNGCAGCSVCQTFRLYERANQTKASISLHGVGHGAFHDGGGSTVASGPCQNGRQRVHRIMKGHFLPLVRFFIDGDPACEDFLWRQWESFKPLGGPGHGCVVVDLMYREGRASGAFVLDNYQIRPQENLSSSGGAVSFDVQNLTEGRMNDVNADFSASSDDAMNGMTGTENRDRGSGVVFEFDGLDDYHYTLEVPERVRDVRVFDYLSFRACQVTRHVLTRDVRQDLTFSVRLIDTSLRESTINIGAYGGGIEEPYQRTGCGQGAGWANEFETIRIRLQDFAGNGSGVDLSRVAAVQFLFGPSYGSDVGRIGLDDIIFTPSPIERKQP